MNAQSRFRIVVENHLDGTQTLWLGPYAVDWQPFGGHYIVRGEGRLISQHSTQTEALEAAEGYLA